MVVGNDQARMNIAEQKRNLRLGAVEHILAMDAAVSFLDGR